MLRALHFINENERVKRGVKALQSGRTTAFLSEVRASGNSSFKYLQNVYTSSDVRHQNVSLALAVSDMILDAAKEAAAFTAAVSRERFRHLYSIKTWKNTRRKWKNSSEKEAAMC